MYYFPRRSYPLFTGCLLIFSLSIGLAQTQDNRNSIENYFQKVRKVYSSEKALATTAYVSEFWRLPGNPGFDSSIYRVEQILKKAGFQKQQQEGSTILSYRLEKRPMRRPAWEPIHASLKIAGQTENLLDFSSNRNMITINSFPTPKEGVEAEVVYIKGCDPTIFDTLSVKGKIVFAECRAYHLFQAAVAKAGAIGVLSYRIPKYNQPERHPNSIPFTSIPFNSKLKSWGINLSYHAKERIVQELKRGPLKVKVKVETKFHSAPELTLVAEVRGTTKPDERFVFSAHVQEPGANDNASGVGVLAEMARVTAKLTKEGKIAPGRTITFLWGDEIRATRRFIKEDKKRAKGIRWGISLDMVGEDTEKTGGTFLIEKMPDPSAIWTRGEDKHTEWGATKVTKADLNPHFFNDFIIHICQEQAKASAWVVNTNPYEGGSDHQPFLDAGKPGLLFWHFTDVFYHTDADRIDKVSPESLYNVGVSALVSALALSSGNEQLSRQLLKVLANSAKERLRKEFILSQSAIKSGNKSTTERDILWTWAIWYVNAIQTLVEIPVEGIGGKLKKEINQVADLIEELALRYMIELGK